MPLILGFPVWHLGSKPHEARSRVPGPSGLKWQLLSVVVLPATWALAAALTRTHRWRERSGGVGGRLKLLNRIWAHQKARAFENVLA